MRSLTTYLSLIWMLVLCGSLLAQDAKGSKSANAAKSPPIPVDWIEVYASVKAWNRDAVKESCPACRKLAGQSVTAALELRRHWEDLNERSRGNFPDDMKWLVEDRANLALLKRIRARKMRELAALKETGKALQQYVDGGKSQATSNPAWVGPYLSELLARSIDYFLNGKPPSDLFGEKDLVRKNSKEIKEYWGVSKTAQFIKLYERALVLEAEILEETREIESAQKDIVTKRDLKRLESLYKKWQQALARLAECENKSCRRTPTEQAGPPRCKLGTECMRTPTQGSLPRAPELYKKRFRCAGNSCVEGAGSLPDKALSTPNRPAASDDGVILRRP